MLAIFFKKYIDFNLNFLIFKADKSIQSNVTNKLSLIIDQIQ
jgi:hypothetical protein